MYWIDRLLFTIESLPVECTTLTITLCMRAIPVYLCNAFLSNGVFGVGAVYSDAFALKRLGLKLSTNREQNASRMFVCVFLLPPLMEQQS